MKRGTKIVYIGLTTILVILIGVFLIHRIERIRLIVRGDDMGYCHRTNLGCIKAYREGILTAVEVMVVCDHFPEAVEMLKENPDLDVGVHLTLTSEWENIKWEPLTDAPSLVDVNGHFFPMTWPDAAYSPDQALGTSDYSLVEIEKELRAQIETALFHLPRCSHATPHMGFHTITSRLYRLAFNLARAYGLDANIRMFPMRQVTLSYKAEIPNLIVDCTRSSQLRWPAGRGRIQV